MDDMAVLDDRAVIEVSGPEARPFLQRLITNDVEGLEPGEARYAALLTPQGKIITDFLVAASGDALLIDAPAAAAADLAKRLTLYKLRAKVSVAVREELGVAALLPGAAAPDGVTARFADPRSPRLGERVIAPRATLGPAGAAARARFEATRIAAGVPDGGVDFALGDTFPHEGNLDRLNGVDFRKGCYVGQEVVSRVHHRGTDRKRIVAFRFEGAAPPAGAEIQAGSALIGTMGSSAGGRGLGLVRLDRLAEAVAAGEAVSAAGIVLLRDGHD